MHTSAKEENLRIVGKNLSDKLASPTSARERLPSEPKFYIDRQYDPDSVAKGLRNRFRELCGVAATPTDAPLARLEVQGIISLCYYIRKKRSPSLHPEEFRRRSWDLQDFWDGKGLPDYVYSVYVHQPDLSQVPDLRRNIYRLLAQVTDRN